MEERIFATRKFSYKRRITRRVGVKSILFFFLVYLFLFPIDNTFGIIEMFYVLFIFSAVFVPSFLYRISYIYEVRVNSDKITLVGLKFDTHWEKTIELKNVNINLVKKGGIILAGDLIIELSTKEEKYIINRLYLWNSFIIYELFKALKIAKGEEHPRSA